MGVDDPLDGLLEGVDNREKSLTDATSFNGMGSSTKEGLRRMEGY